MADAQVLEQYERIIVATIQCSIVYCEKQAICIGVMHSCGSALPWEFQMRDEHKAYLASETARVIPRKDRND